MTIVDIGCGVMPEHASVQESIGIDINFEHGQVTVEFPIIGDAHHLPIRGCSSDIVYAKAILEHLDNPVKCMREMDRIMRQDAYGVILLPRDADTRREVFKRFFKEFPFATFYTLKKMWKWRRYFKIDGLMHKTQITVDDVSKFFHVDKQGIIKHPRPNQWWVWVFSRIGIVNRLYVNEMSEIEFVVIKK